MTIITPGLAIGAVALVLTILAGLGKCPLWIPVLLLAVVVCSLAAALR